MGDVGGILGLFLGFSLMTIIEYMELAVDMVIFTVFWGISKDSWKNKTTPRSGSQEHILPTDKINHGYDGYQHLNHRTKSPNSLQDYTIIPSKQEFRTRHSVKSISSEDSLTWDSDITDSTSILTTRGMDLELTRHSIITCSAGLTSQDMTPVETV